MRYLTRAKLSAFKCYEEVDLELDHVNVFAGANNSGKSAVLAALRRLVSVNVQRHPRIAHRAGLGAWGSSTQLRLAAGDMRDGAEASTFTLVFGDDFPLGESAKVQEVHARFHPRRGTTLWLDGQPEPADPDKVDPKAQAAVHAIERLPVVVIPEMRAFPDQLAMARLEQVGVADEQLSPASLFRCFVRWACEFPERTKTFENHAAALVGEAVCVRVLVEPATIMVKIGDDAERDLAALGSGITAILTLACALTEYKQGLLLYEEPELHLHPRLQRRVADVLRDVAVDGAWQVLLTTHSPHFLDVRGDGVATFGVRRSGGTSRLEPVVEASRRMQVHALLDELGVRPSSGLQTQALIWVEGPSDAIYLRFFLAIAAKKLGVRIEEYVDFAFAFFGGALLAHTDGSWSGPEGALVDLLGVHPNSYVVLDSDRMSATGPLGRDYAEAFVARAPPDRVWITDGREIENYLHDDVLVWAAIGDTAAVAPKALIAAEDRRFAVFNEQVRNVVTRAGRARAAHATSDGRKAAFAKKAVAFMETRAEVDWLAVGDLAERATGLVRFIVERRT